MHLSIQLYDGADKTSKQISVNSGTGVVENQNSIETYRMSETNQTRVLARRLILLYGANIYDLGAQT